MISVLIYSLFILLVTVILGLLWFGPYELIVEEEED